jgi:hypothetical protein
MINDKRKPKCSEKIRPQCHFVHHISHTEYATKKENSDLYSEKPVTTYGMAKLCKVNNIFPIINHCIAQTSLNVSHERSGFLFRIREVLN